MGKGERPEVLGRLGGEFVFQFNKVIYDFRFLFEPVFQRLPVRFQCQPSGFVQRDESIPLISTPAAPELQAVFLNCMFNKSIKQVISGFGIQLAGKPKTRFETEFLEFAETFFLSESFLHIIPISPRFG